MVEKLEARVEELGSSACTSWNELVYALALGVGITIFRVIAEYAIARPVLRSLFGASSVKLPFHEDKLNAAYKGLGSGPPDPNEVKRLSKETGKSVPDIKHGFAFACASNGSKSKYPALVSRFPPPSVVCRFWLRLHYFIGLFVEDRKHL